MGRLFEMDVLVIFYVLSCCFGFSVQQGLGVEHFKIWKPNDNVLNRENWVNPDSKEDCGIVEFAEFNDGNINVNNLTAKEFLLPSSGVLRFLDDSYLRVVDEDSHEKTNCFKLKPFEGHLYFDPRNWDSDVADNPAVPDREKLPCRDDHIKFPNEVYSSMGGLVGDHIVSAVSFGNKSFYLTSTVDFEPDGRLVISHRRCFDPAGCVCNDEAMNCPPAEDPGCLDPVHPKGFCHSICGAYTTFKPAPGFTLKRVEEALKDYSDVYTHVSKVDDDLIQVVFAEKKYTGDSVLYAEKFYEDLHKKSRDFKITDLKSLKKSGSQTNGGSSFFTVFFLSLLFVLGIFCLIFCVYGDRRWLTNFRIRNPSSFPLSSTYRARFSSRDDESGLIFDTQSIAGSVLNLRQSFDNPMFNEAIGVQNNPEEKIDASESKISENPIEINDPLFDLKRLNEELQEEIGTDIVEDLQKAISIKTALVNDIQPLIEVDEEDD